MTDLIHFDGLTLIFYNGVQDWEKNPPKSEEEEKIRVYLSDMKNTDPEKMTSEIARKTCKVYKEDPRVMDNVAEWIRFKYGDQMDMELEAQKKKLEKVHKEELDATIDRCYQNHLADEVYECVYINDPEEYCCKEWC